MTDPTFRTIEIIEGQFPKQTKGAVFSIKEPRTHESGYTVAFAAGKFWVYLSIVIGPRGGIKEQLVVYDPEQKITSDKLFICTRFAIAIAGNYGLLDIRELRSQIAGLELSERERVMTEMLMVQVAKAETAPSLLEERIMEIQRGIVASCPRELVMWERSTLMFLRSEV